jgi:hypothetical protein
MSRAHDRAGAHDGHHVARPDAAGEHADVVAGGQDVGQHGDRLVLVMRDE